MDHPDERVLSAVRDRQQITVGELIRFLERHEPPDKPGVAEDTVTEYARSLNDDDITLNAHSEALNDGNIGLTDGTVRRELDEQLTDAEIWGGTDVLYTVGNGRVSVYPRRWHEALGGTTNITECVAFVQDASGFQEAPGVGTARGVPEGIVLDVATIIGGFEPDEARTQLTNQKDHGELIADSQGLRSREADASESELPPAIDIRDALDEIETNAQDDVSDDIDDIRRLLGKFSERERAGQESLLSEIERDVIDLREHLTGNADRRAEGILNQIQLYRDTSVDDSATLSIANPTLLNSEDEPIGVAEYSGEIATFDGTLVNDGEARDVVAVLTIYAGDDTPVKTVETRIVSLGTDEQYAIEQPIYIPRDAAYYKTAPLNATDTRAI